MSIRRRIRFTPSLLALALTAAAAGACDEYAAGPADPAESPTLEVGAVVLDRLAPPARALRQLAENATRRSLGGGITHSAFDVRLGPGEFDVVRIHRVVREGRGSRPARTDAAVFMVPGSGQTFDAIFLRAGIDDPDPLTSAPVYLAANGIDVWGIDLSFTRVPASLADVAFMADWDVARDVDHTLAAMSIARMIGTVTGQGNRRFHLLGFSYGGAVAYAAASRETRQPPGWRDIAGIVPVDFGPETANEQRRAEACANVAGLQGALAAGQVRSDLSLAHLVAQLALTEPGQPSPIPPFAGLTNFQAALFVGTNPAAFWHFVGVDFAAGVPVGLLYTDPVRWFRVLAAAGSHPLRSTLDVATSRCDEEPAGIDGHLTDIDVPILYVGAGGGFGTEGQHPTSLTASRDISFHMVSLQPAAQRAIDFGHADLFTAEDASTLVWEPIREWLAAREGRPGRGSGGRR